MTKYIRLDVTKHLCNTPSSTHLQKIFAEQRAVIDAGIVAKFSHAAPYLQGTRSEGKEAYLTVILCEGDVIPNWREAVVAAAKTNFTVEESRVYEQNLLALL